MIRSTPHGAKCVRFFKLCFSFSRRVFNSRVRITQFDYYYYYLCKTCIFKCVIAYNSISPTLAGDRNNESFIKLVFYLLCNLFSDLQSDLWLEEKTNKKLLST